MRFFTRQVYGVEGDAGVTTLDVLIKTDEEGEVSSIIGHVDYHSRTPMEEADYHSMCNYLDGECYALSEDIELPPEFIEGVGPGATVTQEKALAFLNKARDYVAELYEKKFKVTQ